MNAMSRLLDDSTLKNSSVVANCTMNRERSLSGYNRELGLDIMAELTNRSEHSPRIRWLDLCCGTGRALAEAARLLTNRGLANRVEIVGLDLVDHFSIPPAPPTLHLIAHSVTDWTPKDRYDLITCVHGLHYLGDKLAVLARTASWLTEDGLFAANFDTRSIRRADGTPWGRPLTTELRKQGFTYDPAHHRISRHGTHKTRFPYTYLGANDQAGPNYTGQPAVNSLYTLSPH